MGRSSETPVDSQPLSGPGQREFAPGFATSMANFFGGRRSHKATPAKMTDEQKQAMIDRHIRKHGVTKCPTKLAPGYEGCLYGYHLA